jgi:mannosylglucosylglycerate synthase
MSRVAIVHYTVSPAIGGVESLIDSQIEALRSLGHVAVTISSTPVPNGSESHICIPLCDPQQPRVHFPIDTSTQEGRLVCDSVVDELQRQLQSAIASCDHCWIHNALTVALNPILTAALRRTIETMPEKKWIAWCEDLTGISSHASLEQHNFARTMNDPLPNVRYVTISHQRRRDLSSCLGLPLDDISVVTPPVDPATFFKVDVDTRRLLGRRDVLSSFPLILVPAKLLPHKNLMLAVEAAGALIRTHPTFLLLITGAPSPHDALTSQAVRSEIEATIDRCGLDRNVLLLAGLMGAPVSRGCVRDLMLLSDVVFFPSGEEGYGMALREAALARATILASDIPAHREAGGETATYFSLQESPEQVARLLLSLATEPRNVHRREALTSSRRFRAQIAELLR